MIAELLLITALAGPSPVSPCARQDDLVDRVAAALARGDSEALDAAVEGERVWATITGGLGLSRMALARYRAESFPDFSFGAELCRLVPRGARVDVLPAKAGDEAANGASVSEVVLRVARELELEYVTLELDGEHLLDATVARVGESVLTTARRAMAVELTRDKAGLLKKLPEPEKSYVRSVSILETIDNKLALGETEAALAAFDTLPPALLSERASAYLRLSIASEVGDGPRQAALGACLAAFPQDLGAGLHALDCASAAGADKDVLRALAVLEKLAPGDGMLGCLRGRAYFQRGNVRGAKIAYGKAVTAQPDLPAGYWGLIEVALSRKDYRSVPKLLTALEEKCSVDLGDLSTRAEFAGFVKSRYYRTWNTNRGG